MTKPLPNNPISPLREKLIGGMNMRHFRDIELVYPNAAARSHHLGAPQDWPNRKNP